MDVKSTVEIKQMLQHEITRRTYCLIVFVTDINSSLTDLPANKSLFVPPSNFDLMLHTFTRNISNDGGHLRELTTPRLKSPFLSSYETTTAETPTAPHLSDQQLCYGAFD